jgi:fumarate reductase subunit D
VGQLAVFLAFSTALLYLAVEQQQEAPVVWLVAGLLGLLVALLAPRKKLLLGLVPPLGGMVISLFLTYREGVANPTVTLNIWVPLALAALVGALVGTRLRLFSPRRRPPR